MAQFNNIHRRLYQQAFIIQLNALTQVSTLNQTQLVGKRRLLMYFPSPSLTLNISYSLSTYIVSEVLLSEFQFSMCVFCKQSMLACYSYSYC